MLLRKPPPGAILNQNHPLARGLILCLMFNEEIGQYVDLSYLRQPIVRSGLTPSVPAYPTQGGGVYGAVAAAWNSGQGSAAEINVQRQGPNRFANINSAHSIFALARWSAFTNSDAIVNLGERTDSNDSVGLWRDGSTGSDGGTGKLRNNHATSAGAALVAGTPYIVGYSQTAVAARAFWQKGVRTANVTNVGSATIGSNQPWTVGTSYTNALEDTGRRMEGVIDFLLAWSRGLSDSEAIDFSMNPFALLMMPPKRWKFISTSGTTYNVSASDSAAATDVADRALISVRSSSDSAAATDTAARGGSVWTRSASDTLTVSTTQVGATVHVRAATDSASAIDAAARALAAARPTTDSAAATDTAARAGSIYIRTASDAAAAGDTAARALSLVYSSSDSISVSDTAARALIAVRSASDTTAASDAASRAGSIFARDAADAAATSDAAGGVKGAVVNTADSAATMDTATRGGSVWVRSAADILSVSNVAVGLEAAARSAADVISVADAAGRFVTFSRPTSDTAVALDVATAAVIRGNTGHLLMLRRRMAA